MTEYSQRIVFGLPPIERELAVGTAGQVVTLFIGAKIPSAGDHLPQTIHISMNRRIVPRARLRYLF